VRQTKTDIWLASIEWVQCRFAANDRILDHACTLLAALRLGISVITTFSSAGGEDLISIFLTSVLAEAGLLDETSQPIPEPVRVFLEARRGEALRQIYSAWKYSTVTNELCLLPELVIEGNWVNDPVRTREAILEALSTIPADTWWSLGSFISAVKHRQPDYQRPAGDYDSWFIRGKTSGEYLRGFEHWDEVDVPDPVYPERTAALDGCGRPGASGGR
jgi:hypothetical protein